MMPMCSVEYSPFVETQSWGLGVSFLLPLIGEKYLLSSNLYLLLPTSLLSQPYILSNALVIYFLLMIV